MRRLFVVCALLAACSKPARRDDAGITRAREVALASDGGVVDAALAPRLPEVWRDPATLGETVSNALSLGGTTDVFGALAKPTEDLVRSELRWVRWGPRGAATVATRTVRGTLPGGPMALLRRGSGFTLVWFPAVREADGGVEAHAIDAEATGFTGDERPATPAEAAAGAWAGEPLSPRRRSGAQELAPPQVSGDARLSVVQKRAGTVPAVTLGETEITSGADLAGYEPSVGFGEAGGGRRWVAVSRGRCQQARIEVFLVDGERVTLRGRFLFGTEVGVRWIRVDARPDAAVVTWYQALIPLRIDCIRGPAGATLADHGVRVGVVFADGDAPSPVPLPALDLPDAAVRDGGVSAAERASSPRSP